jgi:hypothetical protein
MPNALKFTIGIICALPLEATAVADKAGCIEIFLTPPFTFRGICKFYLLY